MSNKMDILIHNAHVYTETRDFYPGWLVVSETKIRLVGGGDPPVFPDGDLENKIDARGMTLLPGFIDCHTHGAVGMEAMDATPEALIRMAEFFGRHGVTSFLPSTWTATAEATNRAIDTVKPLVGQVKNGATILGVHLEGPYLNAGRCGAQDPGLILPARREEYERYLESGIVKMITIAPEYEENLQLADECRRRGIITSIGHSAATYEQVKTAVNHGFTHATHTYNAMTPLGHRELGTVGGVMAFPEIFCELISDNIHVHPAAQKILIEIKGTSGVILVTDSIRGTGLQDGQYPIDNRVITIKDGIARLPDGTLAGSTLTMERALKNAAAASGRSLSEIWPMSSLNAARNLGISATKGSLEIGKDADLILLSNDFEVELTMAEGRVIHQK